MVIFILVFASMIHDYYRPSRFRAGTGDLWNRMELFSLQIMILTLVGGLAMNSTQNMLLPLLQISNSTSTIVKQEIMLYEFKLDFVSGINVTFIVFLAASYLFYTFKYAKVVPGSLDRLSMKRRTRDHIENASIEDGDIQLNEVINPLRAGQVSSTIASNTGVKNPLMKSEPKRKGWKDLYLQSGGREERR